jgi:hypothetical protein
VRSAEGERLPVLPETTSAIFGKRIFLKMTLLNPRTTLAHIEAILARIKVFGRQYQCSGI